MTTDLEGATVEPPPDAQCADAGEFAALWNRLEPDDREALFRQLREDQAAASRCFMQGHVSRLEAANVSRETSEVDPTTLALGTRIRLVPRSTAPLDYQPHEGQLITADAEFVTFDQGLSDPRLAGHVARAHYLVELVR